MRSDPSHELLGIFNKTCQQGETRHTLPCFHPIRRKQKDKHISLYKQYLPLTYIAIFMYFSKYTLHLVPSPATAPEMLVGIS